MSIARLVVFLPIMIWSCSTKNGGLSEVASCTQIKFDSVTLDDMRAHLVKDWKYSYSFTKDTCFLLNENPELITQYSFYKCEKPTGPMADDAWNVFLGICYEIVTSGETESGYLLFNDLKASDKVMALTYSQQSKSWFFINKINKDSLVIDSRSIMINGKEMENVRSLFLPSEQ